MDTTPRSAGPEPERDSGSLHWRFLLVLMLLVFGGLLLANTLFGGGRAL